ncbi:glutamate racemase [Lactobacillus delbrueckii subsp. bulgaricus]|uniref:glutamate racemase n=1 Tax=Lactobacillus delbrueckii TaxID=1584 RepID=UPI001BFF1781|nr:glutamate racemase [Lactobacillus delbrueckii]MBT8800155.1 glutamate racemase [Lactobacillus delbrueckii subsp. bulgaricus]MBT8808936.1 glutamate racemase [Lactobacillus delbrueckii subsp. bulgaricus]MBT8810751.1 glutamate racemase [Lactobacillus delbrueckii subsp. bulgaricus]MBT8826330.1 glutamate racemase [Lactobacillus delbrueckii subsp. bulgaricus]MBT8842198.1 glutamate racemase [Lactobacillus delbrueckii subsp. bulgaricus]
MSKEYADRPIGVFDSGQGGLTVLSRLVDLMPNEDYVFYGDSANAPYGVKSKEEVYQLAKRVVDELIDKHQVKAVMIACNTATSAAADRLRREYSLPIIGIEPAVKPAAEENPGRQVVAMATPLTLEQDKFNQLVAECAEPGQVVKVPAPKLVELIEKGQTDSPAIYQYLEELLAPYVGKAAGVVLGCTHFPFAKQAIQEILGPQAKVYDGAIGAAAEVKRQLASRDELNASSQPGQILFGNSAPAGADLSKRLYALYRQKQ